MSEMKPRFCKISEKNFRPADEKYQSVLESPANSIEDAYLTPDKVPSIGNNWKPKPNGNNVSNNNIYYEPTTTTSTTTSTTMPYSTTTTYGQGRNQSVYAANQFRVRKYKT